MSAPVKKNLNLLDFGKELGNGGLWSVAFSSPFNIRTNISVEKRSNRLKAWWHCSHCHGAIIGPSHSMYVAIEAIIVDSSTQCLHSFKVPFVGRKYVFFCHLSVRLCSQFSIRSISWGYTVTGNLWLVLLILSDETNNTWIDIACIEQ